MPGLRVLLAQMRASIHRELQLEHNLANACSADEESHMLSAISECLQLQLVLHRSIVTRYFTNRRSKC